MLESWVPPTITTPSNERRRRCYLGLGTTNPQNQKWVGAILVHHIQTIDIFRPLTDSFDVSGTTIEKGFQRSSLSRFVQEGEQKRSQIFFSLFLISLATYTTGKVKNIKRVDEVAKF